MRYSMLPQLFEAAALREDEDADGYVYGELQCDEAVDEAFSGDRGCAEDAQHVHAERDATEKGCHKAHSMAEVKILCEFWRVESGTLFQTKIVEKSGRYAVDDGENL